MDIARVDHVGLRVRDLDRALKFYEALGFRLIAKASNDAVAIVKNAADVEINLIYNANAGDPYQNVLMDVDGKYPGYTHVAYRVTSVADAIRTLEDNDIVITQGPVSFGADGHVSVFCRDPDRNVIELRGRAEDVSELAARPYEPEN